ncbi:MAG TPA: PLDc N-terminal domain-containing protein [Blastocatellia bacterium]|nr:PLDc N-terminal domain-containing protein [Blastocatellia bacterium]
MGIGTLLWIAAVVLSIFAITDVMRSSRDTATKVVLIVIILLLPIIASSVYLLFFREKGY